MKQNLLFFWHFALSPFPFIYFFILLDNCFHVEEGKIMTFPGHCHLAPFHQEECHLLQANWDLANREVANIFILSCINQYSLDLFLYVWRTYLLMKPSALVFGN